MTIKSSQYEKGPTNNPTPDGWSSFPWFLQQDE
jgi:hypothetical protein